MSDDSDGDSKDADQQPVSRMELNHSKETREMPPAVCVRSTAEAVANCPIDVPDTSQGSPLQASTYKEGSNTGYNRCSPSSSPIDKDASSSSTDMDDGEDDSKHKSGSGKLDRSKLRKGKWTVEEEEYTSRIIHYFNTGLLTLPDGATLRSYLADKLNCDPMRITKKYAGASCLGRRVYHFHNRPQPTVSQIQLAKAELDLLEQRFRQRVEEGRSGIPSPSSNANLLMNMNLNLNFPPQANSLSPAAALQTLLLNLATNSNASGLASNSTPPAPIGVAQALQASAPNLLLNNNSNPLLDALGLQSQTLDSVVLNVALARAAASLSTPTPVQQLALLNQLLLQNQAVRNGLFAAPAPSPAQSAAPALALSTAPSAPSPDPISILPAPSPSAALAPPALPTSTLPASTQTALLPAPLPTTSSLTGGISSYAEQLKRTYEEHLKANNISVSTTAAGLNSIDNGARMAVNEASGSLCPNPALGTASPVARDAKTPALGAKMATKVATAAKKPQAKKTAANGLVKSILRSAPDGKEKAFKSTIKPPPVGSFMKPTLAAKKPSGGTPKPRTDEDKAAGTILIGFLSSLRDSYEEALRARSAERPEISASDDADDTRGSDRMLPNVTDYSSSQQPESSVEDSDWNSDKKTDPSSSEDSDKDEKEGTAKTGHEPPPPVFGKGPPRKRLKRIAMESSHLRH